MKDRMWGNSPSCRLHIKHPAATTLRTFIIVSLQGSSRVDLKLDGLAQCKTCDHLTTNKEYLLCRSSVRHLIGAHITCYRNALLACSILKALNTNTNSNQEQVL